MTKEAIDHSLHNKSAEPHSSNTLISSVVSEGFTYFDVQSRLFTLLEQDSLYMRQDMKIENGIDIGGNEYNRQLPLPTFDDQEQSVREAALEPKMRRRQDIFVANQEANE